MLLFFLFSFGKLEDSARLTVGFLVPCASTRSTELLGFRATVVGDKQGAVVLHKSLLELVLGVLVNVLLVVGDDGLGDGLADGVDLRGVTTTGNADADVDTGELVSADDQDGLVDLLLLDYSPPFPFVLVDSCTGICVSYLEAEDLRLDQREGLAVDLDKTLALLLKSQYSF